MAEKLEQADLRLEDKDLGKRIKSALSDLLRAYQTIALKSEEHAPDQVVIVGQPDGDFYKITSKVDVAKSIDLADSRTAAAPTDRPSGGRRCFLRRLCGPLRSSAPGQVDAGQHQQAAGGLPAAERLPQRRPGQQGHRHGLHQQGDRAKARRDARQRVGDQALAADVADHGQCEHRQPQRPVTHSSPSPVPSAINSSKGAQARLLHAMTVTAGWRARRRLTVRM